VMHSETFRDKIRYGTILNEVEKKGLYFFIRKIPPRFQAIFGDVANIATNAVFENDTGNLLGTIRQLLNITDFLQHIPVHDTTSVVYSSTTSASTEIAAPVAARREKLVGQPYPLLQEEKERVVRDRAASMMMLRKILVFMDNTF
jgi:hypothetical protein